jgi:hypothetical protein
MLIIFILIVIAMIKPGLSANRNISFSEKESEFRKITKVTLIDENNIRIETWYMLISEKVGEDLPFSNVWSDAIITIGDLKDITCRLNGSDLPYRIQYVNDRPDSKYISASGKPDIKVGEESTFYFSYFVSTSDLYNKEGIVGFKIALSTPKSSKEIPYSFDVGVCSELAEWIPFNPYPESYFYKEENCGVYESYSKTIVKGGEFVLKEIQFQREDLMKIVEWDQCITASSEGEVTHRILYSAEISVPRIIWEIPIYPGGVEPLVNVTVTLLDGQTRKVIRYKTLDDLLAAVERGGFGWILTEYTKRSILTVVLNDPELRKFEINFQAVFPHYEKYEKKDLYTYQIEYSPIFDHINPETEIKIIFEVSDNFYIEKCEPQPSIWESPQIAYYHFRSSQLPLDEPLKFIFSQNQKKSLIIARKLNLFIIICSLIFPFLIWRNIGMNSVFSQLDKKVPQSLFFLLTSVFNLTISIAGDIDIEDFLIHSYSIVALPVVILSVFIWNRIAQRSAKSKKRKKR